MKKISKKLKQLNKASKLWLSFGLVTFIVSTLLVSCDKQNLPTTLNSLDRIDKTPEYYANLRAYKKTKRQLTFGWFAEWDVSGASSGNALRGVPDSTDIIAIWSGGHPKDAKKKEDLRYVQEVKGTKVIFTIFLHYIGDGLSTEQKKLLPANKEEAIVQWAKQLVDTMNIYKYDGIDLDFEPDWCGCVAEMAQKPYFDLFINTISKNVGPKFNTGKLLIIDGSMTGTQSRAAMRDMGGYFDYFLEQAYGASTFTQLDTRFNQAINFFPAEKILMNVNFQNGEHDDENAFTLRDGTRWTRYLGYAKWQPSNGMTKGGIGSYHMQIDFNNSPEYKLVRAGIQIMNPSVK